MIINLFTKIFFFFSIFIFLTSPSLIGNDMITQNLQQKINKSTGEEKIRINIRLQDQFDQDLMLEKTSHLKDKEIKRKYVVNELKTFSQTSQKELLTFLSSGEKNQQVSKIKPLWIVNAINCYATPSVIEELSSMPGIARIDYDQKRKVIENSLDVTPVQEMDNLNITDKSIAWNVNLVNAPDVWEMDFTGEGVIVAVLDTGVNADHLDLSGRMWEHPDFPNHGYNFVDDNNNTSDFNRHGSHCAGTVAGNGTAGNSTGIAPEATIMALKVLDSTGSGTEAGVWEAIEFSVEHGAHIMSLSLGWKHEWNPDRSAWRLAMQNAMNAGLIAAVAAGNEGGETPPPSNIRTPGDCPAPWTNPDQITNGTNSAAVTVGSTTQSDDISSFSSEGPVTWEDVSPFFDYALEPGIGLIVPDVVAPGSNILSIAHNNNSGYITLSGTSMATPAVAGLMALMISKNPNITPQQISQILEESAIPFSSAKSNTYGSGRIDALAAIEATPYMGIIYEDHAFSEIVGNDDGFINPAENIAIDLTLINPTEDTLTDVSISLSVQSSYLQLTDSVAVLGDFEPGETKVFENLFSFLVAENLPGNEVLEFELSAFSDQDTETKWISTFSAKAYAPFLVFDEWKVDDSEFGNDNGRLDPGETATLSIDIRNEGMLNTDSVRVEAESLSDFLIFEQMQVYDLDSLKPDESEVVNWLVSASQETPLESPANIALKASSGVYDFNQNQPVIVGLAPVYSEGNIPTTY
ncbi:MAG: S8 family serine peptidase, partial [Bacteroidota bacterium]